MFMFLDTPPLLPPPSKFLDPLLNRSKSDTVNLNMVNSIHGLPQFELFPTVVCQIAIISCLKCTIVIQIPLNLKENLAAEWHRINRVQPVHKIWAILLLYCEIVTEVLKICRLCYLQHLKKYSLSLLTFTFFKLLRICTKVHRSMKIKQFE